LTINSLTVSSFKITKMIHFLEWFSQSRIHLHTFLYRYRCDSQKYRGYSTFLIFAIMKLWGNWGGIPISQSLDTPRIQVEDSGHRIPQNPVGKMRESHRILYHVGRHWKLSGFFFQWIPNNFLCFSAGNGRKSSGKIRKFFGRNTASMFQRFSIFSCRNRLVLLAPGILCLFFHTGYFEGSTFFCSQLFQIIHIAPQNT